jgi:hypothetical protein
MTVLQYYSNRLAAHSLVVLEHFFCTFLFVTNGKLQEHPSGPAEIFLRIFHNSEKPVSGKKLLQKSVRILMCFTFQLTQDTSSPS